MCANKQVRDFIRLPKLPFGEARVLTVSNGKVVGHLSTRKPMGCKLATFKAAESLFAVEQGDIR